MSQTLSKRCQHICRRAFFSASRPQLAASSTSSQPPHAHSSSAVLAGSSPRPAFVIHDDHIVSSSASRRFPDAHNNLSDGESVNSTQTRVQLGVSMSFKEDMDKAAPSPNPHRKLRLARCPKSSDDHLPSYPCTVCAKEFAFPLARDMHQRRHATHKFACRSCARLFSTKGNLHEHERRHENRPLFVSMSSGDEFVRLTGLLGHEEERDGDEPSSRTFHQFSSAEELNESFQMPIPVSGNVACHTASRRSSQRIVSDRRFRGQQATRFHDGFLRRDDAPPVTFFFASSGYSTVAAHPLFAEGGELVTSLFVSLNTLLTQSNIENSLEHRMYFVGCTPLNGHKFEQAQVRATVVIARSESEWDWCESLGLLRLRPHNCSLLGYSVNSEGSHEWHVASHIATAELGVRSVTVVIAVAGEHLSLSEEPVCLYAAHMFTDGSGLRCPTCLDSFPHVGRLVSHLDKEPATCPVESCGISQPGRGELLKHMRSHFDWRPYACRADDCAKTFKHREARALHERSHREGREELPPCGHCALAPRTRESLARHVRDHHAPVVIQSEYV